MRRIFSSLRLIASYFHANLQAAMEYRSSFASDVFAMLVNDCMWLVFWIAFYERFPAVPGWGRREIVTLWSVLAAGFGLATTLFGNATRLAGLIAKGEMDFFLSLPRPVLLHTLISRMSPTAWGDVVFGAVAFALFGDAGWVDWGLFVILTGSSAALLVGFAVAVGSLAFWLGEAEGLSQQAVNALITFSTHPTAIFQPSIKLVLFTVLPAAFLGFVPVEILRQHRATWLLGHLGVAALFVAIGALVFARGLRRYESGNLFVAR